jgi:hypothetical protein
MHRPIATDHAHHELSLIAGHAAGDLSDTDRVIADTLLAGCGQCAELRRDLVAIAAATRALPAPATVARDFRLTSEQASRLQRGSWLRRLLQPFAAPSSAVRPLATAFTTIGVAGLFVTTLFSGLGGPTAAPFGAHAGGQRDQALEAAQASQAPAAPGATAASGGEFGGIVQQGYPSPGSNDNGQSPNPPVRTSYDGAGKGGSTGGPAPAPHESPVAVVGGGGNGEGTSSAYDTQRSSLSAIGSNPILAGSLALLALGLVLFGLRFAGRRIR